VARGQDNEFRFMPGAENPLRTKMGLNRQKKKRKERRRRISVKLKAIKELGNKLENW